MTRTADYHKGFAAGWTLGCFAITIATAGLDLYLHGWLWQAVVGLTNQ